MCVRCDTAARTSRTQAIWFNFALFRQSGHHHKETRVHPMCTVHKSNRQSPVRVHKKNISTKITHKKMYGPHTKIYRAIVSRIATVHTSKHDEYVPSSPHIVSHLPAYPLKQTSPYPSPFHSSHLYYYEKRIVIKYWNDDN